MIFYATECDIISFVSDVKKSLQNLVRHRIFLLPVILSFSTVIGRALIKQI